MLEHRTETVVVPVEHCMPQPTIDDLTYNYCDHAVHIDLGCGPDPFPGSDLGNSLATGAGRSWSQKSATTSAVDHRRPRQQVPQLSLPWRSELDHGAHGELGPGFTGVD